jgi:SAM-dependent methyltransferase
VSEYSGLANLEVMEEAVRYNDFLAGLVAALARPGEKLLDFGAGNGRFSARLAAQGFDVVCVEPDRHLRKELEKKALRVVADLAEVPSASVHAVYSFNVLEHIEDDAAALAGLHRVLKPDGRLLLYVPAFMVLYSAMDRRVGHIRRYRKQPLARLVRGAGFSVEQVGYADSLGFAASIWLKLFGNPSGDLSPGMVRFYDRRLFPLSRALDRWLAPFAGKNLVLRATRTDSPRRRDPTT